jgi:hypothetical protein
MVACNVEAYQENGDIINTQCSAAISATSASNNYAF